MEKYYGQTEHPQFDLSGNKPVLRARQLNYCKLDASKQDVPWQVTFIKFWHYFDCNAV
jgi:hypothetical protein